jgi:hypothetical protein
LPALVTYYFWQNGLTLRFWSKSIPSSNFLKIPLDKPSNLWYNTHMKKMKTVLEVLELLGICMAIMFLYQLSAFL